MVITPRMPKLTEDDRGPLIRYQALQDLAQVDRGTDLDLNRHRYQAVANRICVGFYSSLQLAFQEVDSAVPLWGTTWEQAVDGQDRINYVLDVVSRRTFKRVAIPKTKQAGA